jgi:hypothetical protein
MAPPPAPPIQGPRTPRRQSLHRAVLIRSAQRAVWAANSGSNSPASTASGSSGSANSNNATPARTSPNKTVLRGWQAPTATSHSTSPSRPTQAGGGHQGDETESDTDTEEEEAEVQRLGLEVVSVSSGESDASDDEVRFFISFFDHDDSSWSALRLQLCFAFTSFICSLDLKLTRSLIGRR